MFTSVVRVECTYIWHVIYCSFSKSSSDIPRTSKLTEGLLVGLVRLVSSFKAPIFPRPAKALTVSQPVKACMPSRASEKPLPALMALACCSSIFKEYVALASSLIVRQYRSNLHLSSEKMWMDPASSVSNFRRRCFLVKSLTWLKPRESIDTSSDVRSVMGIIFGLEKS